MTGVQVKFQKDDLGQRISGRSAGSFWNTPPKAGRSERLRGIATRTWNLWVNCCKLHAAAGSSPLTRIRLTLAGNNPTCCSADSVCTSTALGLTQVVEHLSTPSRWLVVSGNVGPAAFICVVFHCKHCSLAGTAGSLPLGRWQWRWRQPRLDPGTFCFEPPNCLDSLVDSMAWLGGDDQSLRAKLWSEINPNHLSRVSTSEYVLGAGQVIWELEMHCVLYSILQRYFLLFFVSFFCFSFFSVSFFTFFLWSSLEARVAHSPSPHPSHAGQIPTCERSGSGRGCVVVSPEAG